MSARPARCIVWNINPHALDLFVVQGSLMGVDVDRDFDSVVMRGTVQRSPIDIAEMHGFRAVAAQRAMLAIAAQTTQTIRLQPRHVVPSPATCPALCLVAIRGLALCSS